ncbi:MAG: hypothetical protein KDH96_05810 [Candidatus Riesia sp.]|nr:hypothetical protein [Candidatus Riesia sp.]
MIPLWQELHEELLKDIVDAKGHEDTFAQRIIETIHHERINAVYRELLKMAQRYTQILRREYKKKYGRFPTAGQIRDAHSKTRLDKQ